MRALLMKIFFIGICGTATGNVAILMSRLGHEVSGSDSGMYEPMKSALARAGLSAPEGWNPKRLEEFSPDLVVVGNAISRMNPELEFVLRSRICEYTSLPELIGKFLIGKRKSLVISGTHGKTTTTSLSAYLMRANRVDAGWLIGGVPLDLPEGGSNLGGFDAGAPFVIEGDEYDTAYFDKRSKFLHYRPHVLAINNLEFDHADIFRDLYEVKRTFTHVRRIVPPDGLIIENADDENVASLEPAPWTSVMKVGFAESADLRISDFDQQEDWSAFTLSFKGKSKRIKWKMQGVFNARNAAMACAGTAAALGMPPLELDLSPLADFRGVRRRQEVILDTPEICAVEDFGHHPTAIALTIRSLRQKYPGRAILAAFEPRSNTAKTNALQSEFAQSLSLADAAYVGAVNAAKIPPENRMDTRAMAESFPGKIFAFASNAALLERLCGDAASLAARGARPVCVFFSNGSFDNIHRKFAQEFQA